jgi:Ni/Co efflux regulator RcnB
MKRTLWTIALAAVLAAPAAAQQEKKPNAEHIKRDIADHRTMAQAHENAARCLEAGKPEKVCHDQLAKDCKNVGIGKYCGMRHKH